VRISLLNFLVRFLSPLPGDIGVVNPLPVGWEGPGAADGRGGGLVVPPQREGGDPRHREDQREEAVGGSGAGGFLSEDSKDRLVWDFQVLLDHK